MDACWKVKDRSKAERVSLRAAAEACWPGLRGGGRSAEWFVLDARVHQEGIQKRILDPDDSCILQNTFHTTICDETFLQVWL